VLVACSPYILGCFIFPVSGWVCQGSPTRSVCVLVTWLEGWLESSIKVKVSLIENLVRCKFAGQLHDQLRV